MNSFLVPMEHVLTPANAVMAKWTAEMPPMKLTAVSTAVAHLRTIVALVTTLNARFFFFAPAQDNVMSFGSSSFQLMLALITSFSVGMETVSLGPLSVIMMTTVETGVMKTLAVGRFLHWLLSRIYSRILNCPRIPEHFIAGVTSSVF